MPHAINVDLPVPSVIKSSASASMLPMIFMWMRKYPGIHSCLELGVNRHDRHMLDYGLRSEHPVEWVWVRCRKRSRHDRMLDRNR
jgi:hypothetical protein